MSTSPVDVALYAHAHLDDTSSDTSSIGSPSDDEEEDEPGEGDQESKLIDDDEVVNVVGSSVSYSSSSTSSGLCSLGSLTSLEDSLPIPIKKGLSNHYAGKSISFSNLTQCGEGNAADLAKPENPFNKRRRVQIRSRLSYKRRASCSALIMTELPPLRLLAAAANRGVVVEEGDREEEEEERGDVSGHGDDEDGTPAARSFPLFDV